MSLHIFGKVLGTNSVSLAAQLAAHGKRNAVSIALDRVDVEDRMVLEESEHLRGPGVLFSVSEIDDSSDAAQLWIDATARVRRVAGGADCDPSGLSGDALAEFTSTQLGQVCDGVLGMGIASGITLVDGGIEDFFVGSHEACLRRIACDVFRPWDMSPNRLYICRDRRLRAVP
jgi:hypothetical protein